jgi:hypothetical protein
MMLKPFPLGLVGLISFAILLGGLSPPTPAKAEPLNIAPSSPGGRGQAATTKAPDDDSVLPPGWSFTKPAAPKTFDPDAYLQEKQAVPKRLPGDGPWPPEICANIAFEEWVETDTEKPMETITARAPLLRLLIEHCGNRNSKAVWEKKQKADAEYLDALKKADAEERRSRRTATPAPSDYVPPPPHWFEHPNPAPTPRRAAPVETAEPPRDITKCIIRNMGGDGQLSSIWCP